MLRSGHFIAAAPYAIRAEPAHPAPAPPESSLPTESPCAAPTMAGRRDVPLYCALCAPGTELRLRAAKHPDEKIGVVVNRRGKFLISVIESRVVFPWDQNRHGVRAIVARQRGWQEVDCLRCRSERQMAGTWLDVLDGALRSQPTLRCDERARAIYPHAADLARGDFSPFASSTLTVRRKFTCAGSTRIEIRLRGTLAGISQMISVVRFFCLAARRTIRPWSRKPAAHAN